MVYDRSYFSGGQHTGRLYGGKMIAIIVKDDPIKGGVEMTVAIESSREKVIREITAILKEFANDYPYELIKAIEEIMK